MKDEGGKRQDLARRTLVFAARIVNLCAALPPSNESRAIANQLVRSGTSPGAQYREACGAKSDADFISKIGGVLQELDETAYWLELLVETQLMAEAKLTDLRDETDELIAIFVAVSKSAKRRAKDKGRQA